jgi:hypothetical protein
MIQLALKEKMMFKTIKILLMVVALALIFGQNSVAVPLSYYHHVTHLERDVNDEMIWFWSPDTMYGPVHSNDFIGLKYSPHFYGPVTTSQNRFAEFQANPYFEFQPIFNAPVVEFPRSLLNLRNNATPWIPSQNGQKMTWIFLRGEQGIDIYQYPNGTERNDSLYEHLGVPDRQIIFIDGDVEVQGVLSGTLTIGCSGNMYLLDDCVYEGANRYGGFDGDEMPHMLGLASENNIYIANTVQNGRENGWENGGNNLQRHSIVINAALVALNESFTFEHQNDEWERYQGPEPDERGSIYLKGSVAQYRRGHTHRSNHQATGYRKAYSYDLRFQHDGPPGFAPGESGIIDGRYGRVELQQRRTYQVRNADIGTLIVPSGVVIELEGQQPLVVRDSLIMRGSDDLPITVRPERERDRTLFRVERGVRSYVELENVIFEESIETQIDCDSLKVTNCEFNGPATWEGILQVRGCKFANQVSMSSWHQLLVTHSVFENGLTIAGDARDGHLLNNTIVSSNADGLRLRRFRNLEIQNNIIAFNRQGINNLHYEEPLLGYNNVFANVVENFIDCSPGDGSISANPEFVDPGRGDYNLTEGSPCIDSGNPDSSPDPDGTRADIGAYYFDHPNSIEDVFAPTNVESFELTGVYPNPFNSTAVIGYYLPERSNVRIRLFDLAGRLQMRLVDRENNAGSHKIEWTPKSLTAGMYLLQMQAGEFNSIRKVMLLK